MSGMKTRRDGGGGNKVKTRFWQDRRLRQGWDQKGGEREREIKSKNQIVERGGRIDMQGKSKGGVGKKQGICREKARKM